MSSTIFFPTFSNEGSWRACYCHFQCQEGLIPLGTSSFSVPVEASVSTPYVDCRKLSGGVYLWWEFLSHFSLVLTAASEPERAPCPHGREGCLLPGRCHRLAPQQPAGLCRGGSPQLPHALHAAHLPVPHGEERQRRK